jgi:hypothetical protein
MPRAVEQIFELRLVCAANKLLDSISARNATNQTTFGKVLAQQDHDDRRKNVADGISFPRDVKATGDFGSVSAALIEHSWSFRILWCEHKSLTL